MIIKIIKIILYEQCLITYIFRNWSLFSHIRGAIQAKLCKTLCWITPSSPQGPHQHPKLRLTWQPVCCNGKMSLGINITHPDLQETSGCAGLTNATNISHPSGAGLGQHSRAWSSSSAFLLIRSILLSKWERGKTTKCFYSSM